MKSNDSPEITDGEVESNDSPEITDREVESNDSPEITDREWNQMTALRLQTGNGIK